MLIDPVPTRRVLGRTKGTTSSEGCGVAYAVQHKEPEETYALVAGAHQPRRGVGVVPHDQRSCPVVLVALLRLLGHLLLSLRLDSLTATINRAENTTEDSNQRQEDHCALAAVRAS